MRLLWVPPLLLRTLCLGLLQELPEQVYLHPPLSIFVVEKRAFGHTVLVGTHVVSDVMKFSPRELEEEPEDMPKGEHLVRSLWRQVPPVAEIPGPSAPSLARQQSPLQDP